MGAAEGSETQNITKGAGSVLFSGGGGRGGRQSSLLTQGNTTLTAQHNMKPNVWDLELKLNQMRSLFASEK